MSSQTYLENAMFLKTLRWNSNYQHYKCTLVYCIELQSKRRRKYCHYHVTWGGVFMLKITNIVTVCEKKCLLRI